MSRKKVLIVEDDSDLRRLYAIGLNQCGYQVKLAANGAEALDRIAEERPDVILLDLLMPVMSGWEVLARLNPEDRRCIPVVVISGQPQSNESPHHECVTSWLSKPVSLEDMVRSVEQALPAARRGPHSARPTIA